MNGFRGNHRSAGPGKKERKAKAYHHDEACRCSAPFLKLHYNDCPVLMKPCPVHGKVFNRNVKQDKAGKKQNVEASNNPGSKTERLFRPVKSLLTVCDPEMRFNFRYNSPKNSSSHETIKHPTDSDNLKTNLNKRFVEKAKPFVAGQTNKIKKLKQCFHSPCSSILNRSRSQAFVKEKSVQGDFYNGMPEVPPDEKKYDSGFKWFPTGKLNFKTSDKKTGCTIVSRRESNNDNNNKIFGCALKSKKEMKNSDSIPIFDKGIPVFGFPKEATQFVYSSFTLDDPKKKTRDGKALDPTKRNPKEKRPLAEMVESSLSDLQTPSSSDDSDSIYFVPFIVQPVGKKSQEEESRKAPTRTAMTQTSASDFPDHPKMAPQEEVRRDLRSIGVQTAPEFEEALPKTSKPKEKEIQREERPKEVIVIEPSTSDRRPERNEDVEDVHKQASAQSYEIRLTGRDSDDTLYYDMKPGVKPTDDGRESSRTSMVEEKESAEPRQTASRPKESRASQTLPPQQVECASHSQQTSFQEEVSVAISDLAQIKDIIFEYFKRTQPGFEIPKDQVDHQTMTDYVELEPQQRNPPREPTTSRRKSSPAGRAVVKSEPKQEHKPEPKPETRLERKQECKTTVRPKSNSCVPQSESRPETQGVCKQTCHADGFTDADFRCIHVDDLERAAVFCLCSVCGREIKRFSINISRNSEDNQPFYEMQEVTDGADFYSEMFEMKTTRTKVSNAEVGQLPDAAQSSTTQKAIRRRDSVKLSAYEVWSTPPTSSARQQSRGKLNNKPEPSDGKKPSTQPPKEGQRFLTSTPKEKYRDKDGKPRTRSSEFYYPVIIKPLLSRQFTKILEKKFHENASEESDGTTSKQKRTYDKYFDPTDIPAGKKIKHGFEEHPRDCCLREKPDFTDSGSGKYEGRMRKAFATVLPSSNEHFCERHFSKQFEDKRSKSPSRVKSLSLGSLNNLLSSKSCHLKSIPVGCEESSFRDVFEFGARKSVRFLKSNDGGILYHPWPSGVLAYEADEGSASSLDDKKLQTTSRENSPNEEDCCKQCTCCFSDSSDSPCGFPMKDIVEEPDEYDWDSHPRRHDLKPQRRKSRSFPGYTQGSTNSEPGGPFWFGKDQKRK